MLMVVFWVIVEMVLITVVVEVTAYGEIVPAVPVGATKVDEIVPAVPVGAVHPYAPVPVLFQPPEGTLNGARTVLFAERPLPWVDTWTGKTVTVVTSAWMEAEGVKLQSVVDGPAEM